MTCPISWCYSFDYFPKCGPSNWSCSLPQVAASIHAFFLAFSLTLTNIFVRFNPISWWSCTIAGRVCAPQWAGVNQGTGWSGSGPKAWPKTRPKAESQRPKGWTAGKGNLFGAHADDDNKFECQMMPSWFPRFSGFLAFWTSGCWLPV